MTLIHAPNEAERGSYTGFHQWNFYTDNGAFFLAGRDRSKAVDVSALLSDSCEVEVKEDDFVRVTARKNPGE